MKDSNTPEIHIGQMLSDVCKSKSIAMSSIGESIGLKGSTVAYHQKQPILNNGIVLKYSMFFKHNFFFDIAAKLPKDFSTNALKAEEEQGIIASLQEEIKSLKEKVDSLKEDYKIVKTERDLLKEIFKSR